jgi:hypothetical protein
MNRLILLGNGFDLAHGLQTGYNDFILWYVKECFKNAWAEDSYEDELWTINRSTYFNNGRFNIDVLDKYINDCYSANRFSDLINNVWFSNQGQLGRTEPFLLTIKSDLFRKIGSNCNTTNWVDIENEYYDLLKENRKGQHHDTKISRLSNLNTSLSYILDCFSVYLNTLSKPKAINDYIRILVSKINFKDVIGEELKVEEEPISTTIINFNYTDTMETLYREWFTANSTRTKPEIIYIHGKLNDSTNPLIFGFGDELDDDYKAIENDRTLGYFEFIKSFWYFRTSNYRNLLTQLEADKFQVVILGHSCGLSDRTMLNMIFEHDNCSSIKIYYYGDEGENNYVQLTHAISRHFTDKRKMRKRIVSLDASARMHQWNDFNK